jgi:hypothetical protein
MNNNLHDLPTYTHILWSCIQQLTTHNYIFMCTWNKLMYNQRCRWTTIYKTYQHTHFMWMMWREKRWIFNSNALSKAFSLNRCFKTRTDSIGWIGNWSRCWSRQTWKIRSPLNWWNQKDSLNQDRFWEWTNNFFFG